MKDVAATESTAKAPRGRAEMPSPSYNLADAVAVANAIHNKGGGLATPEQLASFLEYKGTNNGAFITRVAAAKQYGLITGGGRGGTYKITPLAERVLMPVYQESAKEALVDAFFNVPLFKAVYEEYKGKELPTDFGFKNMLRTRFGILPARLATAYRILMESAEEAGFFTTRGARTHLIIPQFTRTAPQTQAKDGSGESADRGNGGTGTGERPPLPPQSEDELRRAYIAKLIGMLGNNDDGDPELMTRIEKLLALAT